MRARLNRICLPAFTGGCLPPMGMSATAGIGPPNKSPITRSWFRYGRPRWFRYGRPQLTSQLQEAHTQQLPWTTPAYEHWRTAYGHSVRPRHILGINIRPRFSDSQGAACPRTHQAPPAQGRYFSAYGRLLDATSIPPNASRYLLLGTIEDLVLFYTWLLCT